MHLWQWYGKSDCALEIATGTCVWYHSGLLVVPIRWVLVRDPSGALKPKAFLCTDLEADATSIVQWSVKRWSVEVTFAEVRRHLGVETQRQWSDKAIVRTTPVLLGLFSVVTLLANQLQHQGGVSVRQSAWYSKEQASFSDALAWVRQVLWRHQRGDYKRSGSCSGTVQIPEPVYEAMAEALCYAA